MDVMARRRQLMMQIRNGGLPTAYKQIEWLEGDGSPYINSGIECTSDLIVNFAFMYFGTTNQPICGGIDMRNAPYYFRHHENPTGPIRYYIDDDGSWSVSTTVQTNTKYDVFIDPVNGVATVNSTNTSFTPLQSGLTTGKSYGIFCRIDNDGVIQSKASRFYYFKFIRNNALIGNFIPCIRKSDSKPGMYDTVSKTFYTNAGTGEFIVPA